mgnify:CR=1 FL=1
MQLSLEIMNNLKLAAKKLTTGVTASVLAASTGVLALSQQANAASVTYNSSTNPAVINIPVTSTDWATPPGDTTPYLQIPSFNIANLPAYHQAWAKVRLPATRSTKIAVIQYPTSQVPILRAGAVLRQLILPLSRVLDT